MAAMSTESVRRLSDKIAFAHEQACEQGKADVARHLLQALELELSAYGSALDQRSVDSMIEAAFARQQRLDAH